jgi:hypothetical protein
VSQLRTSSLQHPSSSVANVTLAADGTVVLPQGFTGGIGSNVVSTVTTTTTTTSSSSNVNTSCTATITPTTDTQKVLVLVSLSRLRADGNRQVLASLYRGDVTGTLLVDSAAIGLSPDGIQTPAQIIFLDSPASAAATTYTVALRSGTGGQNVSVQDAQTMTLIEVAA